VKRLVIALGLLFVGSNLYATHLFRNNASNINAGTLPNARLDPSSVTLQGNNISISTTSQGFSLYKSTAEQLFGGFDVFRTTAQTRINNLDSSTATLATAISTTGVVFRSELNNIVSTNIVNGTIQLADVAASVFITSGSQTVDQFHLKNTTVTAGQYTNANISIDADGRIVEAANGAGSAATSTSAAVYNLVVTTVANNRNQIAVTADSIDIMGFTAALSTICDISKVGAGGLNTGSEQAETRYAYWAISDGSTNTVIFSLDTADIKTGPPLMPAGYTKWRKLGSVYNKGNSDIRAFHKKMRNVTLLEQTPIINDSDVQATEVVVDISSTVPPDVSQVCFNINPTQADSTELGLFFYPQGYTFSANNVDGGQPFTWFFNFAVNDQFIDSKCFNMASTRNVVYRQYAAVGAMKAGIYNYVEAYP